VISCDEFMTSFGDYLEGDIAAEVRRELDSHLRHCRTCQVIYDSSRKTLQILTESGSFDLPEAAAEPIREKIMARIRNMKSI
jgi:predicted anti-sigma-YlaC factor YlaD